MSSEKGHPSLDESLIMVCCDTGLVHGSKGFYLYYIYIGETVILYPPKSEAQAICEAHREAPVLVCIWPCPKCRARGIRGPTGYFHVPKLQVEDEPDDE